MMATFAPSAASTREMPSPIPLAPPVTINTLSLSCRSMRCFLFFISCLQGKNLLHQPPFTSFLRARQYLLISVHQLLPFLHFRITQISCRFLCKGESRFCFHDHKQPVFTVVNLHGYNAGIAYTFQDFRPYLPMMRLISFH